MLIIPEYAIKFLKLATIHPTAECRSTDTLNVARHAARVVEEAFEADSVEVFTEKWADRHDPLRKRLKITLRNKKREPVSFIMDVAMAVFMAEKIEKGDISRPVIHIFDDGYQPTCSLKNGSKGVKLSNLVYRELYPAAKRRRIFVDGDVLNLCNWNLYPDPHASFFNMVLFDGEKWYIKIRIGHETERVCSFSQEYLIGIMRDRRPLYEGAELDVSPRQKKQLLFGEDTSMKTWYAHLDRLQRWSPTKDWDPYIQELREDLNLWLIQ